MFPDSPLSSIHHPSSIVYLPSTMILFSLIFFHYPLPVPIRSSKMEFTQPTSGYSNWIRFMLGRPYQCV